MQETRVRFLSQKDPLEKEMATHSSILAWRIPCFQNLLDICLLILVLTRVFCPGPGCPVLCCLQPGGREEADQRL